MLRAARPGSHRTISHRTGRPPGGWARVCALVNVGPLQGPGCCGRGSGGLRCAATTGYSLRSLRLRLWIGGRNLPGGRAPGERTHPNHGPANQPATPADGSGPPPRATAGVFRPGRRPWTVPASSAATSPDQDDRRRAEFPAARIRAGGSTTTPPPAARGSATPNAAGTRRTRRQQRPSTKPSRQGQGSKGVPAWAGSCSAGSWSL